MRDKAVHLAAPTHLLHRLSKKRVLAAEPPGWRGGIAARVGAGACIAFLPTHLAILTLLARLLGTC